MEAPGRRPPRRQPVGPGLLLLEASATPLVMGMVMVLAASVVATAPAPAADLTLPTEPDSDTEQTSPLLNPMNITGHVVDVRLVDVNHCQRLCM